MKRLAAVPLATALLAAATTPLFAQSELRGQANPPAAQINVTPDAVPDTAAAQRVLAAQTPATGKLAALPKPSAAVPADPTADLPADIPADAIAATTTAPRRELLSASPAAMTAAATLEADPDAGIVTRLPGDSGSIPVGMLLKIHLNQVLSTETTMPGSSFTGTISEAILRDGVVLVPAGAQMEGRVTDVHGGRRIGGIAALHLLAQTIVMPDGSRYPIRAQVIDTDQFRSTKVDREGTIQRRDHPAETLAIFSLTTGSAAAAGAVFGGGFGAAVGAGVGAGISTAMWLKQNRQATLPKDSTVVFSFTRPVAMQAALPAPETIE